MNQPEASASIKVTGNGNGSVTIKFKEKFLIAVMVFLFGGGGTYLGNTFSLSAKDVVTKDELAAARKIDSLESANTQKDVVNKLDNLEKQLSEIKDLLRRK